MEISRYLAMTPSEMEVFSLPAGYFPAYMACHFSPYATGLSNIPDTLPQNSMLILNDRTPICGHDPEVIVQQLLQAWEYLGFESLLLDFQRSGQEAIHSLCQHLVRAFPCPAAVSEQYAKEADCPVFLSPAPLDQPLQEYIAPWEGREVWLDIAPAAACITVTESGSSLSPLPFSPPPENALADETLHCLYRTEVLENEIRFSLWRDLPQLDALVKEAQDLGIAKCIGLYQEFCAGK